MGIISFSENVGRSFLGKDSFIVERNILEDNVLLNLILSQVEGGEVTHINLSNYEPFIDTNGNNIWDKEEPYIDKANGKYDIGETFKDIYKNEKRDTNLW